MSSELLYEVKEAHRMAYVFARSHDSYRVFMYDGYRESEWEIITDTIEDAKLAANHFCYDHN